MSPWYQAACVLVVASCGVLLAGVLSNRPRIWWVGYALPLLLLMMLIAGRMTWTTAGVAPFHRIAASQWRYPLLALVISLGLCTCAPRLRFVWQRRLVMALMGVFLTWFCVVPFIAAAILQTDYAQLPGRFDPQGVCRQSRSYTCGPAAAATALRRLGIIATEGQLARLSRSTPFSGTLPQTLAHALETRYKDDGLQCRYEPVTSVEQLRQDSVTLAILREGFLADHCVAVLDVTDHTVVLGDPQSGRRTITRMQFEHVWRGWAIRLRRL